jgi:hypothetical protein
MAHPITRTLGIELARGGRIPVRPDLTLPGHPEVFAVGDIVSLTDSNGSVGAGRFTGRDADGDSCGEAAAGEMDGNEAVQRDFTYRDKGSMATIGRSAAIAQVAGLQFSGFIAWLLWLFVHLIFLVGFRNKVAVLVQWFYSYVRYKRGANPHHHRSRNLSPCRPHHSSKNSSTCPEKPPSSSAAPANFAARWPWASPAPEPRSCSAAASRKRPNNASRKSNPTAARATSCRWM